jgi:hypothetical protein
MGFRDLSEVVEGLEPKELPINGELVRFPASVSAKVGVMLANVYEAVVDPTLDPTAPGLEEDLTRRLGWSDGDAQEVERELLGEEGLARLDQLGVIGPARTRVISTLVFWHIGGQEVAEAVWEGKAQAPNRETRRRTAGSDSMTGGGAGSRTATGGTGKSGARKKARKAAAPTGAGSVSTGS